MARNNEQPRPCPHCGRMMKACQLARHERVCIDNPTARAMYVAALSGDVPGEGITYSQYVEVSANDYTVPDPMTLRRLTGAKSWAGILAEFGLVMPPPPPKVARSPRRTRAQTAEERAIEETAREAEEVRRILAEDAAQAYSLTVCGVRPLAGLYVGGRPVVAMMIR
jgi:hypothetical protein